MTVTDMPELTLLPRITCHECGTDQLTERGGGPCDNCGAKLHQAHQDEKREAVGVVGTIEEAYHPIREALWVVRYQRLPHGNCVLIDYAREDNRYGKVRRQDGNILATVVEKRTDKAKRTADKLLLMPKTDDVMFHQVPPKRGYEECVNIEVLEIANKLDIHRYT